MILKYFFRWINALVVFMIFTFSIQEIFAFGAFSLDTAREQNLAYQQKLAQKKQLPHPSLQKKPTDSTTESVRTFSYKTLKNTGNIKIYKAKESPIFVQEINLDRKTQIKSLLPKAVSYNQKINNGEPEFERKNIKEFVNFTSKNLTSLINGQFFNGHTNPTMLSFGLKSDGEIQTVGADNRGRTKKILTIINGHIKTLPYSWKNFSERSGKFAIVGFDFAVPNRSNSRVGRTYLCPKNPNARGSSHTLLSLVAQEITEKEALQELTKYGCRQEGIVKLDGGGSSRFYYQGDTMYGFSKGKPDFRKIPHMIGFFEK